MSQTNVKQNSDLCIVNEYFKPTIHSVIIRKPITYIKICIVDTNLGIVSLYEMQFVIMNCRPSKKAGLDICHDIPSPETHSVYRRAVIYV